MARFAVHPSIHMFTLLLGLASLLAGGWAENRFPDKPPKKMTRSMPYQGGFVNNDFDLRMVIIF
jgi:hypothetical protein